MSPREERSQHVSSRIIGSTIGIAQAKMGRVRDSHSPRNEECMHNASPAADCSCKRQVTRKPYRVVRVTDPHAMRAHNIVAEIRFDNGLLTLRQKGKRKRVSVNLGVLYERLILNEALKFLRERKKARRSK